MASKFKLAVTSPVGRLVQGDLFVLQDKDNTGAPRVYKTGPKAGQPNPQLYLGVAFAKTYGTLDDEIRGQTEFGKFYQAIDHAARTCWPNLFPQPWPAPCVNPLFAFKVADGDGVDRNGKRNAEKAGQAGHWIVSFGSSYLPKVVQAAGNNVFNQITDPNMVKRGYYIRVAVDIASNESLQSPGLYLNPTMVEFCGYGPEIVGGPDAASVFGQPAALPPGASTVPPVGAPLPAPPVPGAVGSPAPGLPAYQPPGAPAYQPPVAPAYQPPAAPVAPAYQPPAAPPVAPAYQPPAAPVPAVPPNTAYMTPPPAPVAPSPPVSPAGHTMTAAAGGLTREQYLAAGWTDDQLIANGYMVA
jgi:hypothetical protein